jgi:hypothetical protein
MGPTGQALIGSPVRYSPKSFSRHCSALWSVTDENCDKVPLLDDEYMRTEACIRVAILRGSCGGDSGAQVYLFLGNVRIRPRILRA